MPSIKRYDFALISYALAAAEFVFKQSAVGRLGIIFSLGIKSLLGLSLLCAICSLDYSSVKLRTRNIIFLVLFAAAIIYNIAVNSAAGDLLFIILFMFLCKKNEPDDVLKSFFIGEISAWILIVLMWKLKILPDEMRGSRHYMGFFYATFGPNIFMHAILGFVAAYKKKVNLIHLAVIGAVNIWLNKLTDTTAVYYLVWLLILCVLAVKSLDFFKINILKSRLIGLVVSIMPYICAGFTVVGFWIYCQHPRNELAIKINKALSDRLNLSAITFSRYPVTLFGQYIKWETWTSKSTVASSYMYVDSSYLQMIIQYGIVTLILVCIGMSVVCRYSVRKRDMYLAVAVCVALVHGITDPQLLSFRYNPFLIIILACQAFMMRSFMKRGIE